MDIGNIASTYNDIYTSSANQSASRLENQLDTDYSKSTDEELLSACKEFEAYFLEQVMKEMWKTIPKEDTSGSNSMMTEYYQDEMIQKMASDSTETNSLGLAQTLYEQMKRNYSL